MTSARVLVLLVFTACVGTGIARIDQGDDDLISIVQNVTRKLLEMRIVGGTAVTIFDHPYMAALPNCGAAIIAKRWVLTAAHCYHKQIKHVRVGNTYREKGELMKIKNVIKHPKFFINKFQVPYFDLMMLQLEKPLVYSDSVQPIKIGTQANIKVGDLATVIGFGNMKEDGKPATTLRQVLLPIMNKNTCQAMYKSRLKITSTEFCAGYAEGKKDACQGDSGGPLVINNRLIGITSFGDGCARPNSPGVYANVPAMKKWINSVMSENR